ncbi:MliC family protein [Neisseria sp. Ec49-e6-T10]|uniref:MliC family protein n=1 Tax=Neisseria sp. Ec49-e6-T10 TaxID=3140744 RepID=UPI003EBA7C69
MKKMIVPTLAICLLIPSLSFAAKTVTMRCDDGQIFRIAYPDQDHAVMSYNKELILLKNATSASGARYIGEGWQWWTKGSEGNLAVLAGNEAVASAVGVNCKEVTPTKATTKKKNTRKTSKN